MGSSRVPAFPLPIVQSITTVSFVSIQLVRMREVPDSTRLGGCSADVRYPHASRRSRQCDLVLAHRYVMSICPRGAMSPACLPLFWSGSVMCFALGTSIAEIVSAYPTSGGLYSASAYLVPRKYRPTVGWLVGWLNLLGQVAGVASTEFGLSRMIWAVRCFFVSSIFLRC